MRLSTSRVLAVASGSVLLAGAMVVVDAPASAATTDTTFQSICVASSIVTVKKPVGNTITVDAPESVSEGEKFTIRIQPNPSSFPDKDSGATTTNLSRLKYDFAVPANSTFVSADVVAGSSVGLSGVAPNVLLVDNSGNVSPTGSVIRLSGNNQVIANSPTSSTNSEGGIVIPKTKKNLDGTTNSSGETWFRMPAIDVTLKAGTAGVIEPTVRIAGNAANQNANENFSTQLAKASLFGTQWAPTRCSPRDSDGGPTNAGAGPLATIRVDAAPVDEDTVTTLSVPGAATTGDEVTLSASVSPNPGGGTVQFKADGANLGAPVAVSGGAAVLKHSFASAGDKEVTAVFSGAAGFSGSTSAAKTIKVSDPEPSETETSVKVIAPATAKPGAAVELKAELTPADLTGGTVQFKVNGDDVGGPVTVSGGAAKLQHAFAAAGDFTVTAVYSGTAGHSGAISGPVIVSVNDDADPPTPGIPDGDGSLGSSSGSLGGGVVSDLVRGLF
ncbi:MULTISPECIES: Ig-like domain-containing protein [Gordonia]|uniref:Bacterial Ig-like domain-containing protein n=1 Tax=Gordonia sihwensis NBRC 108236 TaxID=1223544 RepID=L7LLJ5_9ACTN|nr:MULTISPECIES: Ig-like domain-containing protein [Gordonia]GAC61990.1 hypothetical protein GSI01S_27_00390 [Gordonia sihwensis NBRC 108236]